MDSVCFFKKISHENIYIYYFIYKPIFSQRKVDFPLQIKRGNYVHEYICLVLENATIFQGMQESGNLAK
jgi:hypothetical protein